MTALRLVRRVVPLPLLEVAEVGAALGLRIAVVVALMMVVWVVIAEMEVVVVVDQVPGSGMLTSLGKSLEECSFLFWELAVLCRVTRLWKSLVYSRKEADGAGRMMCPDLEGVWTENLGVQGLVDNSRIMIAIYLAARKT